MSTDTTPPRLSTCVQKSSAEKIEQNSLRWDLLGGLAVEKSQDLPTARTKFPHLSIGGWGTCFGDNIS